MNDLETLETMQEVTRRLYTRKMDDGTFRSTLKLANMRTMRKTDGKKWSITLVATGNTRKEARIGVRKQVMNLLLSGGKHAA